MVGGLHWTCFSRSLVQTGLITKSQKGAVVKIQERENRGFISGIRHRNRGDGFKRSCGR